MKYNYVYIITNKINHKFYIGKHSTNNLDDGYMGSGITINNAILKYGIENFIKRILCFCDSADDAYKVEEFLVTDNLIKRDDCYNMVVGGRGNFLPDHFGEKNPFFGKHHSEEQKKKWRETRKGKATGSKNPMFGKHHSEEQKKKWSESRKGKTQPKFQWLTPAGEIKIMSISQVHHYHPDWVLYEQN